MKRTRLLITLLAASTALGCGTRGKDRAKHDTVKAGEEIGTAKLATARAARASVPSRRATNIEPVALFYGPMPTGVAVSRRGRVFVNFPKWGDDVDFTVAEVRNGDAVPFPDAAWNRYEKGRDGQSLVSVQSVVVDPADRLWIVDTGSIRMGPVQPNGPKLVCVDLGSNRVVKQIPIREPAIHRASYLNDVRFDLKRGAEGTAYITDSSDKGPNGIIVVDVASGRSWRKLNDHPSTKAVPDFKPNVEGEAFMVRPAVGPSQPIKIGSDGIAISADGKQLYYTPLASRRLYSVSTDALADEDMDPSQVAAAVQDLGDRGFASDGLEQDAQGRVYLTDYENNAVRRRNADGAYETLAQDPRMIWPDTLSLAHDGYLYVTANQLNRQAQFHRGKDQRQRPFALFRIKTDGRPIDLK